jgi:polar amino acid transport system substrate-binding protein
MRLAIVCILGFLILQNHLFLHAQQDTLIVGIFHNPPYVIQTGEHSYEGLSIDLWENIAKSTDIHFKYELQSDFISTLKKLEYKEIDLTINPTDVNDQRAMRFDLTQPFSISSIGVAIPSINRSTLAVVLSNIFSWAFFEIILLLILIILFLVFCFGLWSVSTISSSFVQEF